MTTDPRVTLAWLRPIWTAHGGSWHGPRVEHWIIPEANVEAVFRAAFAAADAARVVPADVAGLVERCRKTANDWGTGNVREMIEEVAAALTALAERAETAERERDHNWNEYLAERTARMEANNREFAQQARAETAERAAAAAQDREADTIRELREAERRLAVATEALTKIERAPAWGAPERWEPTPFEVRQLARAALAKITGEARDAD